MITKNRCIYVFLSETRSEIYLKKENVINEKDTLNKYPNQTFNEDKNKYDKKVFNKCKQTMSFKSTSNPTKCKIIQNFTQMKNF
jgi:hypothetical protein